MSPSATGDRLPITVKTIFFIMAILLTALVWSGVSIRQLLTALGF